MASHDARDPSQEQSLLTVKGLSKRFGGVVALKNVDLELQPGEVRGLVGENGAGKSTLIKILCGVLYADTGSVELNNTSYHPHSPGDAKKLGLQVVHQEFNLLGPMSVAENICIENFPHTWGVLDQKRMHQRARVALDRVGLTDVPVTASIERLGIAHRQLIEIARALETNSSLLILDEPTATLTKHEADRLFELVDEISSRGVSVVLVSHHLDEIIDNCDSVTVMRNGATIFTKAIDQTDIDDMIQAMVGRKLASELNTGRTSRTGGEVLLEAKNLRPVKYLKSEGVSFALHAGEILGIAGLVGAGRTELLRAIFGADSVRSGTVEIRGKEYTKPSPARSIEKGMAFVTEDRRDEGAILSMSIASNVSLASLGRVSDWGLLDQKKEQTFAKSLGKKLALKYGGIEDPVSTLSGGNQQKVVIAKWLARDPQILLLDEPTRGVDVGAKAEIYELLRKFAGEGRGLLIASSELQELMSLCDRIVVMSSHKITGELDSPDFSEERLLSMAYASGEHN